MSKQSIDAAWLREGIRHASEVVVSEGFMPTYQTVQMQSTSAGVKNLSGIMSKLGAAIGDEFLMESELRVRQNMQAVDQMLRVTPEQWAIGIQAIGQKPRAIELIERTIRIAQPRLAASAPELRDTLPDNPEFPLENCAAYRRGREHLLANPASSRWLTLLLFTLARAIGSNTRALFHADQWHDGTFFWFDLERAWIMADGARVGKLVVDGDKKFFSHKVALNLGTDMPRRLAEAAAMAPDWPFFHPPW